MSHESPPLPVEPTPNVSTSANPAGGGADRSGIGRRDRSRGGGRDGRSGGGGGRGHTRTSRPPRTPHSYFKGGTSDMNGHVF